MEKKLKDYHDLFLEYDVLLLADVFKKLKNYSLKVMGYAWVIIWMHQVKFGIQGCLSDVFILSKGYDR